MKHQAFLALGSNLGNRTARIEQALALLNSHSAIQVLETSCLYETEPIDMAQLESESEAIDWFINVAARIETSLPPQELLDACLTVERQLGRQRPDIAQRHQGYHSRTLDIDILFYDDRIIREPGLEIPHPRLHERAFVLVPMLELAPDWQHPALGRSIRELHLALPNPEEVMLMGTRQS